MPKLFLRKEQVPEFVTALKGRHEIPVKFIYMDDGVYIWDRLVGDENYILGKIELEMLESNMKKILASLKKKVNLIDVGCGNGKKTVPFIKALSKNHKPVNYVALDISTEMLALAIKNIRNEIKDNLNTQTFVIDFEEGNFAQITDMLRKVYYETNFLTMLGNTIGNPFDKDRVLANLRESMTFSDYILIGIELIKNEDIEKILSHYKNDLVYEAGFFCLGKVGVKRTDGEIKVVYNKAKTQVEIYFIFGKNVITHFAHEKFTLKKGDKILLLISYKSTKDHLEMLLNKTGFKINLFMLNKSKDYALVLCQPKPL